MTQRSFCSLKMNKAGDLRYIIPLLTSRIGLNILLGSITESKPYFSWFLNLLFFNKCICIKCSYVQNDMLQCWEYRAIGHSNYRVRNSQQSHLWRLGVKWKTQELCDAPRIKVFLPLVTFHDKYLLISCYKPSGVSKLHPTGQIQPITCCFRAIVKNSINPFKHFKC